MLQVERPRFATEKVDKWRSALKETGQKSKNGNGRKMQTRKIY